MCLTAQKDSTIQWTNMTLPINSDSVFIYLSEEKKNFLKNVKAFFNFQPLLSNQYTVFIALIPNLRIEPLKL